MSKVYILYKEDNEYQFEVIGAFSSYAAVITWLKSTFKINTVTEVANTKWFIVYEDVR